MLSIKNLHATMQGAEILKGLNLEVQAGEVHAIMGPNGSGKSTLSKVLAGFPDYKVTDGSVSYEINFKNRNLFDLAPDERAKEGVFLAYQYPTEVYGVSNFEFLRAAFNAVTAHQGGQELDVMEFNDFVREKARFLGIDESFISRQVNVDFSGGEKKRNEILQMAVLSPRLMILDEIDSGLDVDSLRHVAAAINKLKNSENAIVVITHYERILEYITPDHVHILYDGKIIKSGDYSLAKQIETQGYEPFLSI